MIVIKLHRAALVLTVLDRFVRIGPALARFEEEVSSSNLPIICRRRVVSVVMHCFPSGQQRKIVRESDASGLSRGPANREAGISAAIGPHVGTRPVED